MDIETMCKIVEGYIYERKGETVKINRNQFNNNYIAFSMLQMAYEFAIGYNSMKNGN